MCSDIGPVLREWPYDPARNVRKVAGADGSPKLQVRLPLGIEQYELTGRPDGLRPEDEESCFHVLKGRLAQHVAAGSAASEFVLTEEDCARLRDEAILYYFRYLLCFQIGEYDLVERDTERNMEVFRFVDMYAEREEDRTALSQYWPYIIRIHAMARAVPAAQAGSPEHATELLREAVRMINALEEIENQTFSLEKMRSLGVLAEMLEQMESKEPPSERELVRKRLMEAIETENYERAAQLRDLLRSMGS